MKKKTCIATLSKFRAPYGNNEILYFEPTVTD